MENIYINGKTLIAEVSVADNFFKRLKGLLGRAALRPQEGLLIPKCQGIHMFGMKFSIDAIYLDKEKKVLRICENLKPNRIGPTDFKAHYVLEVVAGSAKRTGLKVGDCLLFNRS